MSGSNGRFGAGITGVGMAFPERVLTNAQLEELVDTSDEWIRERTGIRERHIVEKGTPASALAVPAARQALEMADVDPGELDAIIVPTVTPDMMFPATSCIVQRELKAKRAWAFDLLGACSGYVYSLALADGLIRSGNHEKVLVVGSDIMSSIVDWKDRNTCILFGDGAGATVVERMPEGEGILGWINGADGNGAEHLYMKAGGSLNPTGPDTVEQNMHVLQQDGKTVFRYAVEGMAGVTEAVLEKVGLTGADVDLFIPHQANLRIIDYCRRKLKMPEEKVMVTIDRFGNTTSATIPSALRVAVEEKRIKAGDLIVMATFGAGFTWGAAALRWTPKNA